MQTDIAYTEYRKDVPVRCYCILGVGFLGKQSGHRDENWSLDKVTRTASM